MRLPEKIIWSIWEQATFIPVTATNGKVIEIIERGEFDGNSDGPDYIDAKIRINGEVFAGSIEIDVNCNGWDSHHHLTNPAFNTCILHVYSIGVGSGVVTTESGKVIPSVTISDFLYSSMQTELANLINSGSLSTNYPLICSRDIELIEQSTKEKVLYSMGIERFISKCNTLSEHFINTKENLSVLYNIEVESDFIWKYLLSRLIFRTMGYSANSKLMEELFLLINPKFFLSSHRHDQFEYMLESYILNLSGLLPELVDLSDNDSLEYVRKIREYWTEIIPYINASSLSKAQWKFQRVRPMASPYIRMAAAIQLSTKIWKGDLKELLTTEVETITVKSLISKLKKYLSIEPHHFWKSHTTFNKKLPSPMVQMAGDSRITELIINVFLPFLYSYSAANGNKDFMKRYQEVYLSLNMAENPGIVDKIISGLQLTIDLRKVVNYQGALHLMKEYCSKGKCSDCLIGEKLFN